MNEELGRAGVVLPGDWRQLAQASGALKGLRRDKSIEPVLRTLLSHLGCGYSLRETAVRASKANLADLSDVALLKRLRKSKDLLHALCVALFQEQGVNVSQAGGLQVRVFDATTVKEPGRTGALWRIHYSVRRRSMREVDGFYAAAGRALHEDGKKVHLPDGARQVVAGMGLDPQLVDAAIADDGTHDAVVQRGGFGVPTLVFDDGTALFGPVITPAPSGGDAMRLWDLTVGWAAFPHLYELRRPKTPAHQAHVDAQFAPYFDARDWRTISHPAP